MPVMFWNDPDGTRIHDAYFDMYPGIWRHGDWATITDRGSVIMHGRSDATLNRQGIRMGSADIYEAVEQMPEITEAMVIGIDEPDGGYWMPLFVRLRRVPNSTTTCGPGSAPRSASTRRPDTSPTRCTRRRESRTRAPARSSRCRSSECCRARSPVAAFDVGSVDDPALISIGTRTRTDRPSADYRRRRRGSRVSTSSENPAASARRAASRYTVRSASARAAHRS